MKLNKNKAEEYIKEKLRTLPVIENIISQKDFALYDFDILLRHNGIIHVEVYAFQEFYPKYMKNILTAKSAMKNDVYPVIVAPYISGKVHALCMGNNIGYFDLSGNCFFSSNSIYLSEIGNPNAYKVRKSRNDIFNPKSLVSSRILRILIKNNKQFYKLKSLSEEATCSIGQVAKIKEALCARELAKFSEKGLQLSDIQSLLEDWSEEYAKKEQEEVLCYTLNTITEFESNLEMMKQQYDIDYYLTAFSGGVRYAPVVGYNKVHVYIPSDKLRQALHILDCKEVASGANVVIYPLDEEVYTYDSRNIHDSSVVSPVQIYLDSMQMKGRGEELAREVFRKEIAIN